jgi:DNA transformation protein and related proteins
MVRDQFVEHCLELLAPLGAPRARRMFGGHGLYVDEVFVAIIARETLYLKVGETSRPRFEAAGSHPFVYDAKGQGVAMGYWSVPEEAMESPALMLPWARLAMQAALAARAAAAVKRKPASKAAAAPAAKAARPGASPAAKSATRRRPR